MKVIALSTGFYDGSRKRAGDEFEVPNGTKATWFMPVDTPGKDDKKTKPTKADGETKKDDLV